MAVLGSWAIGMRRQKQNHIPKTRYSSPLYPILVCFGEKMENVSELLAIDESLREEATKLLEERGLRRTLEEFGTVHLVGSYTLNLMVWRDLDIFIEVPNICLDDFFELGRRVANLLSPFKMFLTDYTAGPSEYDFHGMYWGIRLGDLRKGAWKIDLHAEGRPRCMKAVKQCESIARRLTHDSRCRILAIKSKIWNHSKYRDAITSQDVYDAVLDHNITTLEEFWKYVEKKS
jgi:hypothetical protein